MLLAARDSGGGDTSQKGLSEINPANYGTSQTDPTLYNQLLTGTYTKQDYCKDNPLDIYCQGSMGGKTTYTDPVSSPFFTTNCKVCAEIGQNPLYLMAVIGAIITVIIVIIILVSKGRK